MVPSNADYFAIKVGCLLAFDPRANEAQIQQEDGRLIHQRVGEKFEQMSQVVGKSPIVSDPHFPEPGLSRINWVRRTPDLRSQLAFNVSPGMMFSVHWPEKNQEQLHSGPPITEDFRISYDGMIYPTSIKSEGPVDLRGQVFLDLGGKDSGFYKRY